MKRYILISVMTLGAMVGITVYFHEPPAKAQGVPLEAVDDIQTTQQKEANLDKTIVETKNVLKQLPEDKPAKPKVVTVTKTKTVTPQELTYYYRIAGEVYQGAVKKEGGFYVIDIDSLVTNASIADTVILHHTDTVYMKKHSWFYKIFHRK
jgi:hypothetical protein